MRAAQDSQENKVRDANYLLSHGCTLPRSTPCAKARRVVTIVVTALTAISMIPGDLSAQSEGRSQARSMVVTPLGIVATSQTLASQAGAQVLARGGNAIDAAIAANAVLHVVEPMSNGLGGDLFAIYWGAKTGKLTGINASGWAPSGLTIDFLASRDITRMPQLGIHSVTVPGCVAGWASLHQRFGKLPWADLLQPAIYYADRGFPVTEIIAGYWRADEKKLATDDYGKSVFLREGSHAPKLGEVFRNPDLARAFRTLATSGPASFYRRAIAQAILKKSRQLGGVMDEVDLSTFEAEWVEPIATEYRGWTVYELPPNGQGIAALQMLNLFERFPLADWGFASPQSWHAKIEAQKLAYADLQRYVADPRQAQVPVQGMLSKAYAEQRAQLIRTDQASCDVPPGQPLNSQGDTIYLSVVDGEGNIVSLIQSIYQGFGSAVAVDGFGFHLHNRAGLFELDRNHPNALAARKRPFHTIIPGFMQKGSLHIGFGIMGGLNQAQAHAQYVSNIVDHGMNIQAALEAPRFTRLKFGGCDVSVEGRVSEQTRQELTRLGHNLEVLGAYSSKVGGGQAVLHDSKARLNYGASSPRKDGAAIPQPDPYWGTGGASTRAPRPARPAR
jgi:gamma-glutamyltranspeptidase / glutathione hydrolase